MNVSQTLVLVVVILVVGSLIIQGRALQRTAFARSLFITLAALFMGGFITAVGEAETHLWTILIGLLLLFIGTLWPVFMAVKCVQHLRQVRSRR